MNEIPVKNRGKEPIYVGACMIPAGETRILPAHLVPTHLHPGAQAPAEPEPSLPDTFVADTLAGNIKDIRAVLDTVTAADLDALTKAETAGQNRKGVLSALAEEQLRRAAMDDLERFRTEVSGITSDEELLTLAEQYVDDAERLGLITERLDLLSETDAAEGIDGQQGPE